MRWDSLGQAQQNLSPLGAFSFVNKLFDKIPVVLYILRSRKVSPVWF